jgi:cob(I)alamin adenosyltransferase
MANEITKLEQRTFEEDDTPEVPPADIVAYNELRSCADLFRMYNDGILAIQPEFQREIVWRGPAQTRFIDSLIKQLPIPSMCFSLDYKRQQWQVIDGLQRMASIIRFLGDDWKLSELADIDPAISGKSTEVFRDKSSELNNFYRRVENLTLPITVIRCDYANKQHTSYLFTIFHRLNTGGMKLNNQEIRNCIFSGRFNDLLRDLNKTSSWLKLNKMKRDTGDRFAKQELILRLFAFHDAWEQYGGRLAKFLNDFMSDHRNPSEEWLKEKAHIFKRTVELVFHKLFEGKAPPKMSVSVLEALLVGVSWNISELEKESIQALRSRLQEMQNRLEFSDEFLRQGLSDKSRVQARLRAARAVFS